MKRFLSLLLALGMLSPSIAVSQSVCTLTVPDTVAGLGTEVVAQSCEPGSTLGITLIAPNGTRKTQNIAINAQGRGTKNIPGTETRVAGRYDLEWQNGRTHFSVLADGPDARMTRLETSSRFLTPDGVDRVTVTIAVKDRFGNPLSRRPIALLSSRAEDRISALGSETDTNGELSWTLQTRVSGTVTLTAYDILSATSVGDRLEIQAGSAGQSPFAASLTGFERGGTFGPIDRFDVRVLDTTIRANSDISIRITALDRNGNTVEDYVGTTILRSTDAQARLPGGGTLAFRPGELGVREVILGASFRTPGEQTLFVEDTNNPSIRGSVTVNVTTGGGQAEGEIVIRSPENRSHVNTSTILLQGNAPSFVNLRVRGGAEEAFGESDQEGVFRIQVRLNPDQRDHTLFVTTDRGTYESRPHHIVLDREPPSIGGVRIEPSPAKTGDQVTISATSEPGLASIVAAIGDERVTLRETSSGSYAASFTAPAPDAYNVRITATDRAGNEATAFADWTVESRGMPTVRGVMAEGRASALYVSWDRVTEGNVAQYRVYIGEAPDNFAHGLNTGAPVSAAIINGLEPNKTYYVAVTALDADGTESEERSNIASATPLGMRIIVTPGNESLLLEWTPPENLALHSYILEYGIQSGVYPERRRINGELRAYTMRDLLNGVAYEMRLTPVAVTGREMPELAATGQGIPTGQGFHPGAGDPVPYVPPSSGQPTIPGTIPGTTDSGFPSFFLWFLGGTTIVGGWLFHAHGRKRRELERFFSMMDHEYRSR